MTNMWFVHAGEGGFLFEEFIEDRIVAIGWEKIGDLSALTERQQIRQLIVERYGDFSEGKVSITASQIGRFRFDFNVGDWVLTFDPEDRTYHLGIILSDYRFEPSRAEFPHVRDVEWKYRISKDSLVRKTQDTLGSISTLFAVQGDAMDDVLNSTIDGNMPEPINALVFRKLTDTDFFNINKPTGTEAGGGGQSYIDISTSAVSLDDWRSFLDGVPSFQGVGGIGWTVPIRSLGTTQSTQDVKIAQRRDATVSIREQKITSRDSNRVHAWNPDLTGFPKPANPAVRAHIYNLHIYIAKLTNGEYWAGWFNTSQPEPNWATNQHLNGMFTENEGYITFTGDVLFDTGDAEWPFRIANATEEVTDPIVPSTESTRKVSEKVLFDEDEADAENASPRVKETIRKVRQRNTKAVKKLKELYANKCQVTGEEYTFPKRNGELYSEAHHLIPLGEGGADRVHNIIIVSPLIHRMFHHARVEGLDLDRIRDNKLTFRINGNEHTITWHPDHARTVEEFNQ